MMGSKVIGYPSAGALGCVTVAFVAGYGWKNQLEQLPPAEKLHNENVRMYYKIKALARVSLFLFRKF